MERNLFLLGLGSLPVCVIPSRTAGAVQLLAVSFTWKSMWGMPPGVVRANEDHMRKHVLYEGVEKPKKVLENWEE